jgi:glycerol uptake facilitator-like aquaporin
VGDITIVRFLVYAAAQFLGAFIGALWVWIIYLEPIKAHPAGYASIETACNLKKTII